MTVHDKFPSAMGRRCAPSPINRLLSARALLTAVSAVILILMIYINCVAMNRDVAADIGHNGGGFQRMLEQSIVYSSDATNDNTNGGGGGDANGGGDGGSRADDLHSSDATNENNNANANDNGGSRVDDLEEASKMLREQMELDERNLLNLLNPKSTSSAHDPKPPNAQHQQQPPQPQTTERPPANPKDLTGMNILLLYADDWTHHTLSSYHNTEPLNTILKTPTLDALASDGVRFTHNCVTTSVCWISRATLYTGQYMSRHGTKEPCCWNGKPKPKEKLAEAPANWRELSFYEILRRNGYHVGHAGKWGVYLPFEKNLDFNVEEDGWHFRKVRGKTWHITEKNEADALRFLVTRPRDRPFLLNVAFYATHAKDSDVRQYMPQSASMGMYAEDTIPIPATATEEAWRKMPYFFNSRNEGRARWRWRFDNNYTKGQSMMKNYYRMATEVDTAIGVILEELRRQDELDNTVIIFTSDNGNFHSEHGLADKWFPHQESIRVPLIVHDPRMKDEKKGTTSSEFTLNIDLAPTILGAAGIPVPDKMMGRDISPLYLSQTSPEWRDEFFYEHPQVANSWYIPSSEALVRKDYKYMYWPHFGYEQLFDLVNDPGELEDIFNSTDPGIVNVKKEMKERFELLKGIVKSDQIVTL